MPDSQLIEKTNTFANIDCCDIDKTTAGWFEGLISEHSHDIVGRISSLKLSLHLLDRHPKSEDEQRLIDQMKNEVDDLTSMINRLKAGSHPCDQ